MADLKAGDGILEMTIQVTRKETGKVEEYILTTTARDRDWET